MPTKKPLNYATFLEILRMTSFFGNFSKSHIKDIETKYKNADEKTIKKALGIVFRTEKTVQKAVDKLKKRAVQQKDFQLLKNTFVEKISRDKALAQIEKAMNEQAN